MALAGRLCTLGNPPSAGGGVRPTDGPPAPRVGARHAGQGREEGGAGGGGGGGCRPGGRGHGPPVWCRLAGPGGRVAPGLCAAPEIKALGGRGARPRAEPPPPPPPGAMTGPLGGGGGWREREGGGRLAEEVLDVLVGVELQAQIEIACLGLGTVTLPRQVPRGRLLHGEEGPQGREEAGWCRARRERQQGPVAERLEGEARE